MWVWPLCPDVRLHKPLLRGCQHLRVVQRHWHWIHHFQKAFKSTSLMPCSTKGVSSAPSTSSSPYGKVRIAANMLEVVKWFLGTLKRYFPPKMHIGHTFYSPFANLSYLKHYQVEVIWLSPPQLRTVYWIRCITVSGSRTGMHQEVRYWNWPLLSAHLHRTFGIHLLFLSHRCSGQGLNLNYFLIGNNWGTCGSRWVPKIRRTAVMVMAGTLTSYCNHDSIWAMWTHHSIILLFIGYRTAWDKVRNSNVRRRCKLSEIQFDPERYFFNIIIYQVRACTWLQFDQT